MQKMKRMFRHIGILGGLLVAFNAYAWMEAWAPQFNCTPAEVEELSAVNVRNFVSTVHPEKMDSYSEYCEGYKIDVNGDGIKDYMYVLPWMGCGLNACGYDAHFRVSAGANKWTDTIVEGYNISKDDLVKVGAKTYFRHSYWCENFENSKHNHWVYQVFSFDKKGKMLCSNSDFDKLLPAVTIYYINPKFKQIQLTSGDLKQIEDATKQSIR